MGIAGKRLFLTQELLEAAMLPLIHRDPFDRIIIAEAMKEKMTVLTKDENFPNTEFNRSGKVS
jgi:PIN domain nuclease of toxin-antitoxin system